MSDKWPPGQSYNGSPLASRPDARVRAIDPALVDAVAGKGPMGRVLDTVRRWVGIGGSAALAPEPPAGAAASASERPNGPSEVQRQAGQPGTDSNAWFGPGVPVSPVAPRDEVAGRQFDFQTGQNLSYTPRRYEGVSFALLRSMAEYDLVRLAIETRKDQLSRVKWNILPKKPFGQKYSPPKDATCEKLEKFFSKPDGINGWEQWVRMIAEDTFVLDGVALYRRKTRDGQPYSLEPIDAATVNLLIDRTGRRPLPPNPAFQQILKGVPAIEFTSDELIYSIRNPRPHKAYGLSPVEQIITYVNLGLRRVTKQLQTYTEGNVPDSLISVPESWTVQQIDAFQRYWDSVMENPSSRRRAKFVPAGINYFPTNSDGQIYDQFDEWLARVVAYAFSLPPTPFVRQMNRATAESAYETALEEGLEPLLQWLKRLLDNEIEHFLGHPSYEFVWDNVRTLNAQEQQAFDLADIRQGIRSIDEVREARGETPLGLTHIVWGIGPLGFMSVDAIKKAIKMGLDMPQPPPPPDMGMGMPGEDPLAGANPELLRQLGLPDAGQAGPGALPPPDAQMGPTRRPSASGLNIGADLDRLEAEILKPRSDREASNAAE
jgi:hypothetical protein